MAITLKLSPGDAMTLEHALKAGAGLLVAEPKMDILQRELGRYAAKPDLERLAAYVRTVRAAEER